MQSESAKIAAKLFNKSIKKKINIIYEQNLHYKEEEKLKIVEKIRKAYKKNYIIFFSVVFLNSEKEAWRRAKERFYQNKRYVPKEYVDQTFDRLYPNLKRLVITLKEYTEFSFMDLYDNSKGNVTVFCYLFFIPRDKFLVPKVKIKMKWKFVIKIFLFFYSYHIDRDKSRIVKIWRHFIRKKSKDYFLFEDHTKKGNIDLSQQKAIVILLDKVWGSVMPDAMVPLKEKALGLLRND